MTHTLLTFITLAALLTAEAATAQSARIVLVSTRSASDPKTGSIEIFSADVDQDSPPLQLTESARINWNIGNLVREKIGIACSPRGDRIAFTANRGGNRDIYLIDIDGTGEVRLTTDVAKDHAPAWSPDGQRIAFRSERSGDPEIFVVNGDGSGLARLTDSPGRDDNPAWSPDGNRIAFTSTRDGLPAIFAMDPDGVLHQMAREGHPVTPELVSRLSPYVRQHIRRFGQYVLDMEDKPEPLQPKSVPLTTIPS